MFIHVSRFPPGKFINSSDHFGYRILKDLKEFWHRINAARNFVQQMAASEFDTIRLPKHVVLYKLYFLTSVHMHFSSFFMML